MDPITYFSISFKDTVMCFWEIAFWNYSNLYHLVKHKTKVTPKIFSCSSQIVKKQLWKQESRDEI